MTFAKTARLVSTLVYYDGPQLLLLRTDRDTDMFAVAIERPQHDCAFFGCEVRVSAYRKYMSGKADLRYVFENTSRRKFYFFSLDETCQRSMDGTITVPLEHASQDDVNTAAYWPDIGFFSRSHTHPLPGYDFKSEEQAFKIDGAWEPRDFSRFYNKFEDLYAFLFVTKRIYRSDVANDEREHVRQSINMRFWQGGGSYVGFYDDLSSQVEDFNPLGISKLKYASPGEMVFHGEGEVFQNIDKIIACFDKNSGSLAKQHSQLNTILGREKVRGATATSFSSDALNNFVDQQTSTFAAAMSIERPEELRVLCGNPVVYCKVVLSVYRRAKELYTFKAEGRIQ